MNTTKEWISGRKNWITQLKLYQKTAMEILVETEEEKGRVVGVKARKLPPDYESKVNFGAKGHIFREFVVEMEDYRPEDFNRDEEWKEIKKKMKTKK